MVVWETGDPLSKSCYCVAIMVSWRMRDGIFSFYIRCDETATRGIALVENDAIRGFSRSNVYSIEKLIVDSDERLRKDRNTRWRVKALEHTQTKGVSTRGFPARLEGEEGEDQFWYQGAADADRKLKVEIQGAWLHDLPWNRTAGRLGEK
jgi:hypothetical protein